MANPSVSIQTDVWCSFAKDKVRFQSLEGVNVLRNPIDDHSRNGVTCNLRIFNVIALEFKLEVASCQAQMNFVILRIERGGNVLWFWLNQYKDSTKSSLC